MSAVADEFAGLDDHGFRAVVRRWIEANYPPALRYPPKRLHFRDTKPWYMALSKKRWIAPGWPREHGGMGLSAARQLIMIEERERHGCARFNDMGVNMLGPMVLRFGTEQQKARFLPKILAGEHIWCQGYSEPGAGSDLAGLRTAAVRDGDDWVVNGSKIWTTLAMDANWIFMLVRTDPAAKKQEGISFLLVPMDSPGITVRPIVNLDMHDEFCEVFFDEVRVPAENLLGEVNRGWTVAKSLLGFERVNIGSPRQSTYALARLRLLAERAGVWEEPEFRARYGRLRAELADHATYYETFAARVRSGEAIGPDISGLKINQTELFQRITEAMLEIAGEEAAELEPLDGNRELHPSGIFLQARPATIYGGSNEIQRNVISRNVLNLPA